MLRRYKISITSYEKYSNKHSGIPLYALFYHSGMLKIRNFGGRSNPFYASQVYQINAKIPLLENLMML